MVKNCELLVAAVVAASAFIAQGQTPARAVWIASLQGSVSFLAAGADESLWSPAEINRPLVVDDQISTIDEGTAEVRVDSHTLHLGPATTIKFGRIEGNVLVVDLKQGSLDSDVPQLLQGEIFEVDSANLSMTLAQSGHYRFELDPNGNTRSIVVRDGLCQAVSGSKGSFRIQAGTRATVSGGPVAQLAYEPLPDAGPPVQNGPTYASNPPQPPAPQQDPGAETLNRYGTWGSTLYGTGWSPNNVATGWAPYTQGQWDYIEPGGWTWVDSEPWGFTPFHYGRWTLAGGRWFWIPGPPVYSPALVAWVGAGPGLSGNVGWFPLGPNEAVVGVGFYQPGRIRYANLAFATVVTRATFVGAQPVFAARLRVPANSLYRASVTSYAAVAPTPLSVVGSRRAFAHPPASVTTRSVVARTPHAPPAIALTQRQQAWARSPGLPLTAQQIHPGGYSNSAVRTAMPPSGAVRFPVQQVPRGNPPIVRHTYPQPQQPQGTTSPPVPRRPQPAQKAAPRPAYQAPAVHPAPPLVKK